MRGRTILGGTTRTGYEVARAFAESRARTLLLSREVRNGDRTIPEIKNVISDAADVHLVGWGFDNIKNEIGNKICKGDELDIIVANARTSMNDFDVSSDGFDRHSADNHLSRLLVSNSSLPLTKKTSELADVPSSRVVSISSELHRMTPSSTQLTSKEVVEVNSINLSAVSLYARTKLANIPSTKCTLVERALEPSEDCFLTAATHPSAAHIGQQDQFKGVYGSPVGSLVKTVPVSFMRNLEQGSTRSLSATTRAGDVEKNGWRGYHFTDAGQTRKETTQACDGWFGKGLDELSVALSVDKLGRGRT